MLCRPISLPDCFSPGVSAGKVISRPHYSLCVVLVFVATISACHALIDGVQVGMHPLIICLIRGSRRLRTSFRAKIILWYLAIVLEGLVEDPFEPLELATDKLLTLKMVFLMAITSLKKKGRFAGSVDVAILHRLCHWYGQSYFASSP